MTTLHPHPEPVGEQPVPAASGLGAIAISLAVELGLVWIVWIGIAPLHWALLGHAALVALLSGYTVWRGRTGHDVRIAGWLYWFTLTLGPLGPISTLGLLIMPNVWSSKRRPAFGTVIVTPCCGWPAIWTNTPMRVCWMRTACWPP